MNTRLFGIRREEYGRSHVGKRRSRDDYSALTIAFKSRQWSSFLKPGEVHTQK